jgi:hypothetical protein
MQNPKRLHRGPITYLKHNIQYPHSNSLEYSDQGKGFYTAVQSDNISYTSEFQSFYINEVSIICTKKKISRFSVHKEKFPLLS